MEQRYLYVVFSSTPYRMGQLIRFLTRAQYNHVSISLEPTLETMYGFARRYYRTPFYGGFVKESLARYHLNGNPSQVRVCRIPVTDGQHTGLEQQLNAMYTDRHKYLYNHLSVIGTPFRRRIPVRDAFICVEFVVDILSAVLSQQVPMGYYSVEQLAKHLEPYVIYQGTVPKAQCEDPDFFSRKPIPHPIYSSIRSITALIPRMLSHKEK